MAAEAAADSRCDCVRQPFRVISLNYWIKLKLAGRMSQSWSWRRAPFLASRAFQQRKRPVASKMRFLFPVVGCVRLRMDPPLSSRSSRLFAGSRNCKEENANSLAAAVHGESRRTRAGHQRRPRTHVQHDPTRGAGLHVLRADLQPPG